MKQHARPVIIDRGEAVVLRKVALNTRNYDEAWIQNLCYDHPHLLPIEEIEPTFAGAVSICKEFSVLSGYIDLLYINEYGFITIGECKLWRNPEARRKVIGQILDYAKDLSKFNYKQFEQQCLAARKDNQQSLFELMQSQHPDIEEASFIDQVQQNLQKGRFLLAVIGDGIRGNMEEIAAYIHRNGNLNFTLGLIEIPVYEHPDNGSLVITPRLLVKTKEIERVIYRIAEGTEDLQPSAITENAPAKSISEKVFFERLEEAIGRTKCDDFRQFLQLLNTEMGLIATFGRGKRVSLNIKTADEFYNFASIQDNGEVWFYGIVTRAVEAGNQQIGVDYLVHLAELMAAQMHDDYSKFQWCVKRNSKYINIIDYLEKKDAWKELMEEVLEKINELRQE